MLTKEKTVYSKDTANKKMTVVREFAAPLKQVWAAWTEKDLLDTWWAPKPWKAETKTMSFKEGGYWLYCMTGPDGTKTWSREDYKSIVLNKSITAEDYFCDENGNKNANFPTILWKLEFQPSETGTKMMVEMSFANEVDMKKLIDMGFESGFASAHDNLDELLAKKVSG
jgi:uncharacterized protein YndB with AHSA1/START domain